MSYYYLISGLPDLNLNKSSQKIDFGEIVDTIQRNLNPEDERSFRYLLYPNDNRNLLNVLFVKYKNFPEAAFFFPSILSVSAIQDYGIQKTIFPSYMSEFLNSYEDQFASMTLREMEDQLWGNFYREVEKQDPFIGHYFLFDRQLKELTAWYNASHFDFLSKASSKKDTSLSLNQPGKAKPVLADLPGDYPYLEKLEEAIASGLPDKIEQCVDQIKWSYLSQVPGFFGREQVFVYVLKLLVVLRWQKTNPEEGENHFSEIQENIKQKVNSTLIPIR